MRDRIGGVISETCAAFGLKPWSIAGVILALALCVPVLAQLTYLTSQNADSRAVIGARDDDASNAIDIAGHSHWYSSNGFYPYGPVYFRVAHVIGAALAPLTDPGGLPLVEARSKAMHFGLMLTSVLGLFGLAFLLAGIVTDVWWARLGLGTWFIWALLKSETWQVFILRAHPDHVLSLAVAAATWATARVWQKDDVARRRVAAWAWGLALAVKMTLLMWLPFLIASLVLPWRRERVREARAFAGHAALVFFAVGFPQNFNLYKIIRFLRGQSALSLPATGESVTEWLVNWGGQLKWPLSVLFAALILTVWRAGLNTRARLDWRPWALGLGPLGIMLLQKVLPPHDHYPMPIVATQLALVATSLDLRPLRNARLLVLALFVSVIVFSIIPAVPEGMGEVLTRQLTCRPQARAVARAVTDLRAKGFVINADPYVPIMSHLPNVHSTWEMSFDYLRDHHFDALVLSWTFADRYAVGEVSDYAKRDNLKWPSAVEVYGRFKDHDAADVPGLGTFRRVLKDECGWEVWERGR